jgi:hypothetical protein
MRQDDGLLVDLGIVTIFSGQHVNLSLIHAQLADISLQEEDISALHARVQHLSNGKVITLISAHDSGASLDSVEVILSGDVHNSQPILVGVVVDLLRGPQELHVVELHASGLPDLDKVSTYDLDLLKVTTELIVKQGKPISDPEDENTASIDELIHVDDLEDTLGNVHSARGFKTVIADRVIALSEEGLQVLLTNALLTNRAAQVKSLLNFQSTIEESGEGGCLGYHVEDYLRFL